MRSVSIYSIVPLTLLLLGAKVQAVDAAKDAKLPKDAQVLLDGFAKTSDKLEDDYRRKLGAEREKLYAALDKACSETMKKGDLDGALAIKREMKALMETIHQDDDSRNTATMGAKLQGRWDFSTSGGFRTPIEIHEDGSVTAPDVGLKSTLQVEGDDVVLRWANGYSQQFPLKDVAKDVEQLSGTEKKDNVDDKVTVTLKRVRK